MVLGIEYVDARLPDRPWRAADLDATLDALETVATELTPAPADLELDPFADEFAEMVGVLGPVRASCCRTSGAHPTRPPRWPRGSPR